MVRTTTIRTKEKGKKVLWIGLVSVIPNPNNKCFGDARGAYVNVISYAISAESFRKKIKQALDELDISLSEVENPQPLRERLFEGKVNEEILRMADTAKRLNSVVFGTFHTYGDEEES